MAAARERSKGRVRDSPGWRDLGHETKSPAGAFWLVHRRPAYLAGLGGRLAVDPDGCVYAEIGAGEVLGLAWPNDYSARLGSDQCVEILNQTGDVVLREGQLFRAAGGFGPDERAPWDTQHEREDHGRHVLCIETAVIPLATET